MIKMEKILKKYKAIILFIVIVALSAFLRFHNLSNVYVFNFDEEYQATYAWTEVKNPHPIWIGVSASFLDFYLGPYFTYFTAILLAISHGDPMITAFFAAFLGLVTTIALFFTGWKIFSLKTGTIAALLYTSLPLFVFFDQKYWNTMFVPLITILLFVSIYLIKKSYWWWVLFAALFGIVLETHLEPAPLTLIGVWYFIRGGYFKKVKLLLVCLVIFAIFYWPLAVFDRFHNFSNWAIIPKFNEQLNQSKIAFNPTAKYKTLFDSLGRFWYLKPGNPNADEINFGCTSLSVKPEFKIIDKYAHRTYAPWWLSLITIVSLLIFLAISIKSKSRQEKLLGIFLTVALVFFTIFPGGSSEYYALSILVLFTFVPGILISRMRNFQLPVLFFTLASLVGVNTVLKTSDEFSLGPKKVLISKVMSVIGNDPFSIEGRGLCHDYEGWRYLFKVYGRVPNQSYTDKNLGWLYPEEIDQTPSKYTVILSEDRIPLKEDLSSLPSIKEGGYRAYIRRNQ